jgi:hypothetical protein
VAKEEEELATLKSNPIPPPGNVEPAVPRSPGEPPAFLGLLTGLANESGCRIAGMSTVPSESKADQLARPIRTSVELECMYPQIRSFLYRAANAERVLAITDVRITAPSQAGNMQFATTGPLRASIGVERYVTTPTTN